MGPRGFKLAILKCLQRTALQIFISESLRDLLPVEFGFETAARKKMKFSPLNAAGHAYFFMYKYAQYSRRYSAISVKAKFCAQAGIERMASKSMYGALNH
jgi:hypothetical protein